MFPLNRNQSVALQAKSSDWFLYDENIGLWKVKQTCSFQGQVCLSMYDLTVIKILGKGVYITQEKTDLKIVIHHNLIILYYSLVMRF